MGGVVVEGRAGSVRIGDRHPRRPSGGTLPLIGRSKAITLTISHSVALVGVAVHVDGHVSDATDHRSCVGCCDSH